MKDREKYVNKCDLYQRMKNRMVTEVKQKRGYTRVQQELCNISF